MKRRNFFKRLGLIIPVAIIAPRLLLQKDPAPTIFRESPRIYGGEMAEIKWIETERGKMWYWNDQVTQLKLELLKYYGEHSLNKFLKHTAL